MTILKSATVLFFLIINVFLVPSASAVVTLDEKNWPTLGDAKNIVKSTEAVVLKSSLHKQTSASSIKYPFDQKKIHPRITAWFTDPQATFNAQPYAKIFSDENSKTMVIQRHNYPTKADNFSITHGFETPYNSETKTINIPAIMVYEWLTHEQSGQPFREYGLLQLGINKKTGELYHRCFNSYTNYIEQLRNGEKNCAPGNMCLGKNDIQKALKLTTGLQVLTRKLADKLFTEGGRPPLLWSQPEISQNKYNSIIAENEELALIQGRDISVYVCKINRENLKTHLYN